MIVSIHQPNFMPWYPYFQKMEMADVFVLLTHCQFEKNLFQNRFNANDQWYTMSVNKGMIPIVDKKYASPERDWKKIKKGWPKYSSVLDQFDCCISESLCDTNIAIIYRIIELLGIRTKIVLDKPSDKLSTERLVEICEQHKATTYIAGSGGSREYLNVDLFDNSNIKVLFQDQDSLIKTPIIEILYDRISKCT